MSEVGGFTYDQVMYRMTPQQIQEANIALDIMIKAQKNRAKGKGKRR